MADLSANKLKRRIPNPARLLATGFLMAIAIGTFLLSLPPATADGQGLPLVDAFFMATSATAVTGLMVVDPGTVLSPFGQVVILTLIQVGALGIMTVTTLFAYAVGRRLSLRETLTMGEALGQPHLAGVLSLTRNVAILTLVIEGVGALILTALFSRDMPLGQAAYFGIFHAISAFANAGFDLFGRSLIGYTADLAVNLTFIALIVTGGLGFYVITELLAHGRRPPNIPARGMTMPLNEVIRPAAENGANGRNGGAARGPIDRVARPLSLHTRVVLKITGALILAGTLLILLMEWSNPATLGPLAPAEKLLAALFQAVTPRTAGFNTVPIGGLYPATLVLLMVLMFIGASPGSTGGGIKTTTFLVVAASIRSSLRGRDDVEIANRRLPAEVAIKSWVIAALSLVLVVSGALILLVTETGLLATAGAPLGLVFETVSAFGTVGLSTGVTPELSTLGRIVIPILMYAGRIGPLTLAVALTRRKAGTGAWHLPEERVIVG